MATPPGTPKRRRSGGHSRGRPKKRNRRWGSQAMVVSTSPRREPAYRSMFVTGPFLGLGTLFYHVMEPTGMAGLLTNRYAGSIDRVSSADLLARVNTRTRTMRMPDGQVRAITDDDAVRILGVRGHGRIVQFGTPMYRSSLVKRIRGMIGLRGKGGLKVSDLEDVISRINPCCMNEQETIALTVASSLLAASTLLGPRQSVAAIPEEILPLVQDPWAIGQYNIARYSIDVIMISADRYQATVRNGGEVAILGGNYQLLQASVGNEGKSTSFFFACGFVFELLSVQKNSY